MIEVIANIQTAAYGWLKAKASEQGATVQTVINETVRRTVDREWNRRREIARRHILKLKRR